MRCPSSSVLFASLLLLGACAQGGGAKRPASEVKIAASHHLFGFLGATRLAFPIDPKRIFTDRGTLVFKSDGTYGVKRPGQAEGTDDYALAKDGTLSMLVSQGPRRPKIRFSGAYGLEGDTGHYYFVDRFTTSSAPNVGLFWGTKLVSGTADLQGGWHVFTHHMIFAKSQVLDPDNVGRAMAGTVTVDKAGALKGQGFESTKATLVLGGSVKTFADGRVDVVLKLSDKQSSDERTFLSGAAPNLVLGLDETESDGESGLLAMVRKRTGKADLARLAGDYHVGMHTIFVDASRAGTDAATGLVSISSSGALRLEAVGSDAQKFTYTGKVALSDDGALKITIDGTKETWAGAVDQGYHTLVIADNFVEQRSGNKPAELNLMLALRKATTK